MSDPIAWMRTATDEIAILREALEKIVAFCDSMRVDPDDDPIPTDECGQIAREALIPIRDGAAGNGSFGPCYGCRYDNATDGRQGVTAKEIVSEIWRIGLMDPAAVRMENAVALIEADRKKLCDFIRKEADILEEQGFSVDAERFREELSKEAGT